MSRHNTEEYSQAESAVSPGEPIPAPDHHAHPQGAADHDASPELKVHDHHHHNHHNNHPFGEVPSAAVSGVGEPGQGASFFTQLYATIRRQLIQKRRGWIGTLVEIFLPTLFMLGLLAIKLASGTTDVGDQNFSSPSGPISFGEIVRDHLLCYDGNNTNTHADLELLLPACTALDAATLYRVPLSEEVPVEGLAVRGGIAAAATIAFRMLDAETDVEIPNFDEYVLFKWVAVTILPAPDNLFMERIGRARQPGKVFVAPRTPLTRSFVDYMNNTFVLFKHTFGGYFNSRPEALPFIRSLENEGKSWALYDIPEAKPQYLRYTLSMNISATNMLYAGPREEFVVGLGEKDYAGYLVSGALTLQKTINDFHATQIANMATPDIFPTGKNSHLVLTPMPLNSYTEDDFLQVAGVMAPFLLVLSYLYSVSQLAKRLVEEKEQRLREGTMIMGLSKAAFFSSWLLVYYAQMIITSLTMAIIMKAGITKQTDFFVIWISFLLFSFATVNMSAIMATFFSKSKIAALCVPLLYFLFSIPAFALPDTTGPGAYHALSFLCPMPFAISLKLIYNYEINNGMGWNAFISSKDKPYNYGFCFFWYIFDFIIYLLGLIYFDNVLPKDWGTRLHPCYCCCICCTSSRENSYSNAHPNAAFILDNPRNAMQKVTNFSVLQDYPMLNSHATIHINQLRKEFDGANGKINVAVDGMELRLFPDSITVFLGHNGAGKTTVMNMMTGMMSPTAGDITIYGNSILTNMQAIRKDIGFCPQHNILWDDLTCMEHLQYFARLKGYNGDEVDEEAIELLTKVDLLDKKDVFSKNLSGGQKRKLSVAIAFMGRARLVLLDEPTAGMDVAARRHTWDVLKDMAKGRTILLTTHFMDEADLLGNRIAIMSKGSLHSYGTSMFLKNNLGSGYVMRIASAALIADPNVILAEVQSVLPGAVIRECKGQELAIELPKDATRSYPAVIRHMDSPEVKHRLAIVSVSVSVSSLEDVFLSIAHHEDLDGKSAQELADEETLHQQSFEALERVYLKLQQKQRETAMDVELGTAHKHLTMGTTGGFGTQLKGMLMKRINHGRRDYCALCLQILAPLICILVAMGLGEITAPSPAKYEWDNSLYDNEEVDQVMAANRCPDLANYWDRDFHSVQLANFPTTYNFSGWLLETRQSQGDRERFVSFSCNDTFGNNVLFSNATAVASAPQSLNQLYRAKLRAWWGNADATIIAAQHPFPFSDRQESQIDTLSAVLMALFILIPFTFVPSTYVAFVVRERECKSKHLQFVSGARYVAYWLANFIFDLFSYCVTVLIAFIIFVIFDQEWVVGDGTRAIGAIVLFLLYGLSAIGFAYLVSYLFDNHSTAQTVVMLVNFLIGFLFVLLMYFLRNIDSTKDAAEVIVYFFLVAPPFALGDGLFAMVMANAMSAIEGEKSPFSFDVAGYSMLYMGIFTVIFMGITLFIDHPSRARRQEMMNFKSNATAPIAANEDEDVARERMEVEQNMRPTDVVQVRSLRKEFDLGGGKQKVAVQNITFGVKPGEVFGFLGTNGAGKTTTMSMLTTDILPTCGVGTIGGFDIVKDSDKTRRLIGYCPQFDAIMDLLTPVEHLKLFASLRGIDPQTTHEVIDALIDSCGLSKYRDIPAGSLSGGNKRKLSVAMSLIGGPSIVFLDEPSAGMDPHARRMLWDVIIFVAKHSSVVLTTHHLEEVDVLAHRVGIMDAGLMKCLGSLEHLKHKFGKGFELTLQVKEGCQPYAINNIEQKYPSAVLVEARQQRILYTLPFESTDLASLFETVQRLKDEGRLGILDYTLQQTSLEQVFLRISQLGEEEEHARASGDVMMSPIYDARDVVGAQDPYTPKHPDPSFYSDPSPQSHPLQHPHHGQHSGTSSAGGGDVVVGGEDEGVSEGQFVYSSQGGLAGDDDGILRRQTSSHIYAASVFDRYPATKQE